MTAYEKETHIHWNDEEDFVEVFTCHKKIMNRMKRLGAKVYDKCILDGNLRHVIYHISKDKINIGLNPKRTYTDEQKRKMQEQGKAISHGKKKE